MRASASSRIPEIGSSLSDEEAATSLQEWGHEPGVRTSYKPEADGQTSPPPAGQDVPPPMML